MLFILLAGGFTVLFVLLLAYAVGSRVIRFTTDSKSPEALDIIGCGFASIALMAMAYIVLYAVGAGVLSIFGMGPLA